MRSKGWTDYSLQGQTPYDVTKGRDSWAELEVCDSMEEAVREAKHHAYAYARFRVVEREVLIKAIVEIEATDA